MAVADPDEATRSIPVVDFGPAFRDEPGGPAAVARQVREASEHVGFFYLAGHGVADGVIEDAFAASREFHALPLADKLALRLNENNIGYLPVDESSAPRTCTAPPARTTTRASSSATTAAPITRRG